MLHDHDTDPPQISQEIAARLAEHAQRTSAGDIISALTEAVAALAPDLELWCEAQAADGPVVLGLPGDRRATIVGDVPPATGVYFIEIAAEGGAMTAVRRCSLGDVTGLACAERREHGAGGETRRRRWTLAVGSRAVTIDTQQAVGADTADEGELVCRTLARALGWPVSDDIPAATLEA
jgi:hypothetical protein